MSNSWFQFKQFKVEQAQCAMKVSTDACLLGAWISLPEEAMEVLDVGTGTGLLALMLAQRYRGIQVDAIEIDKLAFQQASSNFSSSPWSLRLNAMHADANQYNSSKRYDALICNPPFFHNSLLSEDEGRNKARHIDLFGQMQLLHLAERILHSAGTLSLILPVAEYKYWEAKALQQGWKCTRELGVVPKAGKAINRILSSWTRKSEMQKEAEELIIYESDGSYTAAAKGLLEGFYLAL